MSYLAEADIEWEAQTPSSRRKILRLDEDLYVAIVQWDTGFRLPGLDEHGGEEIVYVLQGTFTDQYHSSGPGPVIRGEPGSSHQPHLEASAVRRRRKPLLLRAQSVPGMGGAHRGRRMRQNGWPAGSA
jgi:anti-sigma factor ChrR (cupin superfamily)